MLDKGREVGSVGGWRRGDGKTRRRLWGPRGAKASKDPRVKVMWPEGCNGPQRGALPSLERQGVFCRTGSFGA